ncbi:TonB-dependent receptor (plasmid) [Adhaeribacter swui]|uniref:TonB-dependent receptor n=1 Tax=Adhaeribacter swui TaxID=2086471 RepID=A0A7G7G207_9BACT|nr:TonB-dependent receptor [Adhaeribacter swui]QNF31191.1 TonB-dependent receptor [Adhaeribacter swui]
MKKILIILLLCSSNLLYAQNSFTAVIKDDKSGEALIGASAIIKQLMLGATSNANGRLTIPNIPDGTYIISFSYIGFIEARKEITFPLADPNEIFAISLEPSGLSLGEVTVTATRTNSRIEDIPIRVEVIGQEEIEEKANMKPGNISMLLSESSGIQTQQTSATSGNISIRIQGLDGRYTQILKDGFPLYSGFSSGLSLMQIPPLDLKQVELIKGASSALYGGDAVAGIINLVSKTPTETPEWSVLLNQTHKGGRDVSSFFSNRKEKLGITFLASQSTQNAYDVNKEGFTDLPELQQNTLSPKAYYYINDSTTLSLGITSSFETRSGGDIFAIKDQPTAQNAFVERNRSSRHFSQLRFDKKLQHNRNLTFKNSFSYFQRNISVLDVAFGGKQLSSYTEASYLLPSAHNTAVIGVNLNSDAFRENQRLNPLTRNYSYVTAGAFIQNDWRVQDNFTVQAGLRTDLQSKYGAFVLPRLSLLYKFTPRWSARAGGGLAYKTPTIFNADTEQLAFQNVASIAPDVKAERAAGANMDVNYNGVLFDEVSFSFNQAFYYTRLKYPLLAHADVNTNIISYGNAPQPIDTRGFETNVRFAVEDFKFFAAYTFINTLKRYDPEQRHLELTPKHKLVLTLVYEKEKSFRGGLEGFYTGQQYLSNGQRSPDYWVMGLMGEKMFKHFSLIANLENFTDTRQTRFGQVVLPPYKRPSFRQIYAPLDGFIANLAVKVTLK